VDLSLSTSLSLPRSTTQAQEEYDRFISDARLQSRQDIDQERKELKKNLESEKKR
jgi:hypothetical protein